MAALHQKTKPPAKPPAKTQTLGKNVDEQILQILSGKFGEKVVRTKFIQMTLSIPGVVGACYVSQDAQDLWAPAMSTPIAGRVPGRRQFTEHFSEKCDQFITTGNVQTTALPWVENLYCLLYTSPSPRDRTRSRMPSSA